MKPGHRAVFFIAVFCRVAITSRCHVVLSCRLLACCLVALVYMIESGWLAVAFVLDVFPIGRSFHVCFLSGVEDKLVTLQALLSTDESTVRGCGEHGASKAHEGLRRNMRGIRLRGWAGADTERPSPPSLPTLFLEIATQPP